MVSLSNHPALSASWNFASQRKPPRFARWPVCTHFWAKTKRIYQQGQKKFFSTMRKLHIFLIIGSVVLYAFYVFYVNIDIPTDITSEIILASVFFFALFIGYFITRQNERYIKIAELLASRDGAFSYLYRISGLVPRIQKEVREIIRSHYKKISESNNWAYHEFNPSTTLTELTRALFARVMNSNHRPGDPCMKYLLSTPLSKIY